MLFQLVVLLATFKVIRLAEGIPLANQEPLVQYRPPEGTFWDGQNFLFLCPCCERLVRHACPESDANNSVDQAQQGLEGITLLTLGSLLGPIEHSMEDNPPISNRRSPGRGSDREDSSECDRELIGKRSPRSLS